MTYDFKLSAMQINHALFGLPLAGNAVTLRSSGGRVEPISEFTGTETTSSLLYQVTNNDFLRLD